MNRLFSNKIVMGIGVEGLGELVSILTRVYGCVRWGRWCDLCECVRNFKGVGNVVPLLGLFFISNKCVVIVYAKNIHVTNMEIQEIRAKSHEFLLIT